MHTNCTQLCTRAPAHTWRQRTNSGHTLTVGIHIIYLAMGSCSKTQAALELTILLSQPRAGIRESPHLADIHTLSQDFGRHPPSVPTPSLHPNFYVQYFLVIIVFHWGWELSNDEHFLFFKSTNCSYRGPRLGS